MFTIISLLLLAADPSTKLPPVDLNNRVVYFTAYYCGPCHLMKKFVRPMIDAGEPISMVETTPEVSQECNVTLLPTILLIVDGKKIDQHVGPMTEEEFRAYLARIPKSKKVEPKEEPKKEPVIEKKPSPRLIKPEPRPVEKKPESKGKGRMIMPEPVPIKKG